MSTIRRDPNRPDSWWASGNRFRPAPYRALSWVAVIAAAGLGSGPVGVAVAAAVAALGCAARMIALRSLSATTSWEHLDALPPVHTALGYVIVTVLLHQLDQPVDVVATAVELAAVAVFAFGLDRAAKARGAHHRRLRCGDVVWADVRFTGRDDQGRRSKKRPILVVRDAGVGFEALYLTSQDRDGQPGWVRVHGGWSRRPSWADCSRRIVVPYRAIDGAEVRLDDRQLDTVLRTARRHAHLVERR